MKTKLLPIYRRSRIVAWALVDSDDFNWLSQWTWHLRNGYVMRQAGPRGNCRVAYLHREILGLVHGDGIEVDHRNNDPLDNRRSNLRKADRFIQNQNRRAKRVHFDKQTGKWRAEITLNGVKHRLGRFVEEHEAQKAILDFMEARV